MALMTTVPIVVVMTALPVIKDVVDKEKRNLREINL